MYTVYCYAYYFTMKGTNVGNSGLCYYQGWNFKKHCCQRCIWLFFLWNFMESYGISQYGDEKMKQVFPCGNYSALYLKVLLVPSTFIISDDETRWSVITS